MADFQRNYIKGRMNKSVDERLVPNGEYIHAENVRLGSTEISEIGAVENSRGNLPLTSLSYGGQTLSENALAIGALEDGANEELYWFVHDPTFKTPADGPGETPTGILDLVVSFNTNTSSITYHVISVSIDGNPDNGTTLNFNPTYLITGVDIIDGLLFWTDDFNPPRKINVNRNYPDPVALSAVDPNIDGGTGEPEGALLLQENILVIKRPPVACPGLELSLAPGEENYLEDRFISFAYRYKYRDNEYSAVSQFTEVAFQTESFDFSPNSKVNEGAINRFNTATITYNSGSSLVIGIDLLFKESVSNVIKVIEFLDKGNLGLADNQEYEYVFRNAKIFTVLPESELLRLYDNVPRLAQAQTLMGNRLMYGNYVDGYDLIDINGTPIRFEYINELVTQEIGLTEITDRTDSVDYTVDVPITVNEGQVIFNLANADLTAGALLSFSVTFEHDTFSGGPPNPVETSANFTVEFQYTLPQDFPTVFDLATNQNFQEAIGVPAEILPVYDANPANPTSCEGVTLTDRFNCAVPDVLDASLTPSWTKFQSGISAYGQAIQIVTSPGSSEIGLEFLAMERVDDVAAPINRVVEYFNIVTAEAVYQEIGNTQSLHSDRDYEVGIIYMDEYNRASTALVSPNNTVHIPCEFSDNQNKLKVTIPATQRPPYWATRFKFCIKPSKAGFFTVFTRVFFTNPLTNYQYFLLEGENAQKVEEGDRLKVKKDASGPVDRCLYATVLEKAAQEENFIEDLVDELGNEITVPAGTYMKMKANFNVNNEANQIIAPGEETICANTQPVPVSPAQSDFARIFYNEAFSIEDSSNPGNFIDIDIPVGSRISIFIKWNRRGRGGTNCERRRYILELDLTASQNYDNIIDWWNGDNVDLLINTGVDETNPADGPPITNEYDSTVYANLTAMANQVQAEFAINKIAWSRVAATNEIYFFCTGTKQCVGGGTDRNKSCITVEWEIVRAASDLVFETEPSDASPSLWFEGSQSFRVTNVGQCYLSVSNANAFDIEYLYELDGLDQSIIIPSNETVENILITCGTAQESPATPTAPGTTVVTETNVLPPAHTGNVQSQVIATNTPAIIDLDFFNCFAFGNGVETIRVRDSIKGRELALGDRFTSVANVDYKEANRFADITYSGIFNDESNVNKLNEFNIALLNFKALEDSYGPIQKLQARSTDILTLQEDKISYVLAGKNLLSDAAVGGAITSVPEVLGTQIARLEEYGISSNPESYAQYGYNKYFSDQKRGAVLMLKGTAYTNEQLMVISESGMRSWFRDVFILTPNNQKLGGYDPYMDEYVYSINNRLLPLEIPCVDCGTTQQFTYNSPRNFCYNVGELVGDVIIDVEVIDYTGSPVTTAINFVATYNGVNYILNVNSSGTFNIIVDKNTVTNQIIDLFISGNGVAQLIITVNCPDAEEITIYQVCVSADANGGEFIHNEYRWLDGTYISPLHSTEVELANGTDNPLISQFDSITGLQGAGVIPADGAIVTIQSNKIAPADTFNFVTPPMTFRFLRTNTLFANTPASVASLIAASSVGVVDQTLAPTIFSSQFAMPVGGDKLYLIYDYRRPTLAELCYGNIDIFDVCCLCDPPERFVATQCRLDGVVNTEVVEGPYAIGEFVELDTSLDGIKIETCTYELTANTTDVATALVTGLSTITDCTDLCQKYTVTNNGGVAEDVEYLNCGGVNETATIQPGTTLDAICARDIVSIGANLVLDLTNCVCEDQFIELKRCVDKQSTGGDLIRYAVDNLSYNVSDIVVISEDPDCLYEITQIGLFGETSNSTVVSVNPSQTCEDACNTYEVTNTSLAAIVIDYGECGSNKTDTITILAGQSELICTSGFITDPIVGATIVWQSCDCDVPDPNFELQECVVDGSTPATVIASWSGFGTVQVGDYVEISGSLCLWEVIAETQDPATDIITARRTDVTGCEDSCDTYTLENLGSITYTVNYLDCAGVQQSVSITPTGVQSVCSSQFLGPPVQVDIVKSFCGCTSP